MDANEQSGIRARWADARAEVVPERPTAYAPTSRGPVRRAGLYDAAGRLLLWVWTDDRDAAGSLYAEPEPPSTERGRAQRAAKAVVHGVLRDLYRSGAGAAAVLDSADFGPDYSLGAIERAPSPAG